VRDLVAYDGSHGANCAIDDLARAAAGTPGDGGHRVGPAALVVLRTTRTWKADCIFVGATSRTRAALPLPGTASGAVADRARCSVEVVRTSAG
jgi:nucleotide-binding universal stress UspA family protein